MLIFAISLGVLLLIVTGMAVGVIMGRKPIKGSCGGVGAALGEENYVCEICGDDPARCDKENAGQLENLAYEVSSKPER